MLPRRERLLLAAPVQSGSRVRGHVAASTDLASINARLADARSGSAVAVAEAQSGEILWSRSERGKRTRAVRDTDRQGDGSSCDACRRDRPG